MFGRHKQKFNLFCENYGLRIALEPPIGGSDAGHAILVFVSNEKVLKSFVEVLEALAEQLGRVEMKCDNAVIAMVAWDSKISLTRISCVSGKLVGVEMRCSRAEWGSRAVNAQRFIARKWVLDNPIDDEQSLFLLWE